MRETTKLRKCFDGHFRAVLMAVLMVMLVAFGLLGMPQHVLAQPNTTADCTGCHADWSGYALKVGYPTPTMEWGVHYNGSNYTGSPAALVPTVAPGDSFEIDFIFRDIADGPTNTGAEGAVRIVAALPYNVAQTTPWTAATPGAGNQTVGLTGWNTAWENLTWSLMGDNTFAGGEIPAPSQVGYTVIFNGTAWDGSAKTPGTAFDDGSAGDLDGTPEEMGGDIQVTVPANTPDGTYTVYFLGVGHVEGTSKTEKASVKGALTVTVAAAACSATTPADLAAGSITDTTASLSWTYDGTNNNYYNVYESAAQVATNVVASPYAESGLTPNTAYSYTVRGYNTAGTCESADSNAAAFTTLATVPNAPTVNGATTTSLDVTIDTTDANPSGTEYAIWNVTDAYWVSAAGGNNGATPVWQNETTWGTVTVTGLTDNTLYSFQVRARNSGATETANGTSGSASTLAAGCAATAPGDLASGTITATTVDLTWTYDSVNNNYDNVYRDAGQIDTNNTAGAFSDTGRTPNTAYAYTVRGYNTGGTCESGDSNTVNATTLAVVPNPPTVANPGTNSVDVTIDTTDTNPSGTEYAIWNVTDAYWVDAAGGNNGATPVWQNETAWGTVTVTGLTASTVYNIQVRARNANNVETANSTSGSATTGAANQVPSAPVIVGQYKNDGTTPIAHGKMTNETTVKITATMSDPDADTVQLEVEIIPIASTFDPSDLTVTCSSPGFVTSGTNATATCSGLIDPESYKWRIRGNDGTDYGPWTNYVLVGDTDVKVDIRLDFGVDTSSNTAPNEPTGLGQFKTPGAGGAAITQGTGYTNETSVVFKGTVSDPDTNNVRLQIEIKPTASAFDGTGLCFNPGFVADNTEDSVTCSGLSDGVSYKWRARTDDGSAQSTPWTVYGGSDPDFTVDTTVPVLNPVSIASNNTDTTLAKAGDTITVSFTSSENITTPTVTIAGQSATVGGAHPNWTATYVMQATDTEGNIAFNISGYSDTTAGNAGAAVSATTDASAVTFDKTAPTTTDNGSGAWTNAEVTVTLTPNDGTGTGVTAATGIYGCFTETTCTPAVLGGNTMTTACGAGNACDYDISYYSVDDAGNQETTVTVANQVRVDLAAPAGGSFTATGGDTVVNLDWSGWTDLGSNLDPTTAFVVSGQQSGTAPACGAGTVVYSGNSATTSGSDTGLTNGLPYSYRLCVYDAAGNITESTQINITPSAAPEVNIGDGSNPLPAYAGPSDIDVLISTFTVQMSSGTDTIPNLTLTGVNTGGNVARVEIFEDNGGTPNALDGTDTSVGFINSPTDTMIFTGINLAANTTLTQYLVIYDITAGPTDTQAMTVQVSAATSAGAYTVNETDDNDATITIDASVPTTTDDAPAGWQTANVTVTLTEADTGSGVASTLYCVDTADSCAPGTSGTSVNVTQTNGTAGTQFVRYYSTDAVGNVQTLVSRTIQIDKAFPVTTDNAPAGWVTTNQTVTLTPTDTGSGIASTVYCVDTTNSCAPGTSGTSVSVTQGAGTEGTQYVRYYSTDAAGNVEAVNSATVQIDKKVPTVSGTSPADSTTVAADTSIVVTWDENIDCASVANGNISAIDNGSISGNSCTGPTNTATYTVTGQATSSAVNITISGVTDVAGNTMTPYVFTYNTSAVCTPSDPTIFSDPPVWNVVPGRTADFTVIVTNNDSGPCVDRNLTIAFTANDGGAGNYNAATLDNNSLTLSPGTSGEVTLSVPAKAAGAVSSTNTNTLSFVAAGPNTDVATTNIVLSTMVHNSENAGSSKWNAGGWGTAAGQYGAFDCSTCHEVQPATGNIKRVKDDIGTAVPTIPGAAETVVFTDANDGTSDFGNDDVAGRPLGIDRSDKVCEVCHTYDVSAKTNPLASGVYVHAYDMSTSPVGDRTHNNDTDCMGCHNHDRGFAAGGCDSCHGEPPVDASAGGPTGLAIPATGALSAGAHSLHAVNRAYECAACHNGADGGGAGHKNNTISIGFADLLGEATYDGGSYDGDSAVTAGYESSDGGTTTVTAVADNGCSGIYCHGSTLTGAAKVDPTWTGTVNCGDCHGATAADAPSAGSHTTHASSGGQNLACAECHNGAVPGAIPSGMGTHVDNSADFAFNTGNTKIGGSAAYSGTAAMGDAYGDCSNIYCHSSGQSADGNSSTPVYATPTWGAPADGACGTCHQVGDATLTTGSHTQHLSSTLQAIGCNDCHTGAASDASSYPSANHVNEQIDVAAGVTYDLAGAPGNGYGTCSTAACHGAADWGGTAPSCDSCHLGAGDVNDYEWQNSSPIARIDSTEWTTSGHGGIRTANLACLQCHDGAVSHNVGTNYFRLKDTTTTLCMTCHNTAQGITPAVDGAQHYGTGHSATEDGGQLCWDCHDPHGDAPIKMIQTRPTLARDTNDIPTKQADVDVSFTNNAVWGDYVVNGGDYNGVCQICHDANVYSFSKGSFYRYNSFPTVGAGGYDATHNTGTKCTTCHKHSAYQGSGDCGTCHGGSNVAPSTGAHDKHRVFMNSANFGGLSIGDPAGVEADWNEANYPLCAVCHDMTDEATFHKNATDYVMGAAKAASRAYFNGGNPTYNAASTWTCSNVDCHFRETPAWK